MNKIQDFEEFLKLLNKYKVRYLIVGGYAYAIHAEPRFTKDLDIFIESSKHNAQKLLKVLEDFGFGSLDISENDFLKPAQVIQLGQAPMRIDLLTSISGVSFDDAWKNKISGKYGKQSVLFIGKEDFKENKRATGRKSDKDDLDKLR